MRTDKFGRCALFALCVVLLSFEAAAAISIDASNPYGSFIEPGQPTPLQNAGPLCASTALMNSFVFLDNTYPSVYGSTALTRGSQGSLAAARDELCGVIGGATNQNIWQGKHQWINTYASNTTTFEGMAVDAAANWMFQTGLTRGAPTTDFLLQQLMRHEDVEIGITGGAEHELTLTSLTITDGAISIDYIDPNCVQGTNGANPGPSTVAVTQQADGLHFGWRNGNGLVCSGATVDVVIDSAWAESPVPEPSTVVLSLTALVFMGTMYLRRHRKVTDA